MRGRLRLLLEPLPRGRFPREGLLRSLSWGSPRAPALTHSWRSGRVSAGSRPHGCAASGHEARPWRRDRHPSGKLGEARLRNDALSHRLEPMDKEFLGNNLRCFWVTTRRRRETALLTHPCTCQCAVWRQAPETKRNELVRLLLSGRAMVLWVTLRLPARQRGEYW